MAVTTKPCGCAQHSVCLACDPPVFERNNYFCGKLMVERDFWADQLYHIGKHRLHTRFLHGSGTVCGLRVKSHPNCPDLRLLVGPGLAIDSAGREIFLREREEVEIAALLETLPDAAPEQPPAAFYLCARYEECYTEDVPALFSECGCDAANCHPNRIRDGHRFALLTEAAVAERPAARARVALRRSHVISIAGTRAIAVDDAAKRLYVLNDGAAAAVIAYGTEDQMPLAGATPAGSDPRALAASPARSRLYAVTTFTRPGGATPIEHAVLTFDTAAMGTTSALKAVADLGGTAADKGPVLVAPTGQTDPLVYVAKDRAVLAFQAAALDTDADASKAAFAVGVTAPVTALAATRDGRRLYIATDAAVAVADVAGAPAGTLAIMGQVSVAAGAADLAISPDDEWIYVASGSGTLSAVHAATLESQIKAGKDTAVAVTTLSFAASAALPARAPAAVAVSENGLWLYLAADQGGHLLAVDARKLANAALLATSARAADRAAAVLDEIATLPGPTGVTFGIAGQKLFVVSQDVSGKPGGIVVVDVREEPCDAIFDLALEDCPACAEDDCVILARITGYKKGETITEEMIANDTPARRVLYSTEILADVIKCALEHAGTAPMGPAGPRGLPGQSVTKIDVTFVGRGDPRYPAGDAKYDATTGILALWIPEGPGIATVRTHFVGPGDPQYPGGAAQYTNLTGVLELWIPKGEKGDKGDPGPGLDPGLTHITAVNWLHGVMTENGLNTAAFNYPGWSKVLLKDGFIVAFDGAVDLSTVNHHTFLVAVRRTIPTTQTPGGGVWTEASSAPWQEMHLFGDITAVDVTAVRECLITAFKAHDPANPVKAVRFKPAEASLQAVEAMAESRQGTIRIVLKGDFILDADKRPIDPENMHRVLHAPPLPDGTAQSLLGPITPGQPCASGDWVPGGDFESWIDLQP